MRPFEASFSAASLGTCATCGMRLTLPGISSGTLRYCCHGCADSPDSTVHLRPPARENAIAVSRAVQIAESSERVAAFLSDIELLALYEQKLVRVRVVARSADGRTACATADGQFALLSYHLELHFSAFEGGGYQSTLCAAGPIVGLRGTFAVKSIEAGCIVTHVEQYEFKGGQVGAQIGRLFRPYIGWSMARELRTLKRLVEDPAALAEAVRMRDPRRIQIDPRVLVWDPTSDRPARRAYFARVPTPHAIALLGAFGMGTLAALVALRRRPR